MSQKFEPIIVIGMHRSGTSLLSSLLKGAGVHMGAQLSSHVESLFFQHINRSILSRYKSRWDDVEEIVTALKQPAILMKEANHVRDCLYKDDGFRNSLGLKNSLLLKVGINRVKWGWKDPRNTITLPVWLKIFPKAKVIHIVRNGIDVAISLLRRELGRNINTGIPQDAAIKNKTLSDFSQLWALYTETGFNNMASVAKENKLVVRYEDLLAQKRIFYDILRFIGIENLSNAELDLLTNKVNPIRLDNSYFRGLLGDLIPLLPKMPLMARLGYESEPDSSDNNRNESLEFPFQI